MSYVNKHNTFFHNTDNFLTVSMIAYSKGSNIQRIKITNGVGNKK